MEFRLELERKGRVVATEIFASEGGINGAETFGGALPRMEAYGYYKS